MNEYHFVFIIKKSITKKAPQKECHQIKIKIQLFDKITSKHLSGCA